MGYNTEYRLTWNHESPTTEEVCAFIASTEYWNGCDDAVRDALQGQSVTWRHWQEDLKRLAAKWPQVTFTMNARGDDLDDAWAAFFRGNQSYQMRVEFPQADENRLCGRKGRTAPTAEHLMDLIRAEEELGAALDQMSQSCRRAGNMNHAAQSAKQARDHRHDAMKRIVHFCNTGEYATADQADLVNRESNSPQDLRSQAATTRHMASFQRRTGQK